MKLKKTLSLFTSLLMLLCLFSTINIKEVSAATINYYVAPNGSDSNVGTSKTKPFKTIAKAVSQAKSGSTIYLASGTYNVTSTIKLDKSNSSSAYITIKPLSGTPVIDFSNQPYADSSRGFQISGSYYKISGLKIVGAGDNGIYISGKNNKIEKCTITKCRDTGLQISNGGDKNTISNVTSTYNYDPKTKGENADGFAAKLSIASGNVFKNCYAYYNSDDGFDFYDAKNAVKLYDCEASYNGVDEGNGNGFKIGGNYSADKHYLERCKAVGNTLRGYDQNNNTGALTLVDCSASSNYVNYYFKKAPTSGSHSFKNCTSTDSKNKDVITGAKTSDCSFIQ